MRKNILYMIDMLAHGGTEKQLMLLMAHLDRDRFNPHLVTLWPSPSMFDSLDIPKLELGLGRFRQLTTLGKLRQLHRFIREHEIDLVQTFFQDSFLLGALLKPMGHFKLVGAFRDLGFWRSRTANLKMRFSYPFFDGFVANSQAVRDHFASVDGLTPEKIAVVYNGLRPPAGEMRSGDDLPPLAGIVSNFNRDVKRVDDFIRVAALVREQIPETTFMVVGGGTFSGGYDSRQAALVELSQSLGLGDSMRFMGTVPDPAEHIRRFSVGVITSATEGFSNAIIEYMSQGVPVVATATGGNSEQVIEGETGFLAPVGDSRQLADRIIRLLRDPHLRRRMGQAGYERVCRDFSIEQMVAGHERYYLSLLGGEG